MKSYGSSGRRNLLAAAGGIALLAASAQGDALQSTTTTFTVQAAIVSACTVAATAMTFTNYNPSSGTANDATSTINVFCTTGTAYTLKLNVGTGGGTFATTRLLTDGTNTLNFNLYTTTARSTIWGDGTSSTGTVTGTGLGLLTPSPQTVFGRISAGQDKPASVYLSTVTVTVEYT